jgi:hypothetical protein
MKTRHIYYIDNIGFINLQNCKPRQVYINTIGAYYLKRCNKTKQYQEIYLKN